MRACEAVLALSGRFASGPRLALSILAAASSNTDFPIATYRRGVNPKCAATVLELVNRDGYRLQLGTSVTQLAQLLGSP